MFILSTLIGYLTTQTNCWVAQWDNWLGGGASTVITSHTYAIQHNLVQVKNHATSSLTVSTWLANDPSYLSQSSMRGMMARIRKWSWKNWPLMKVLNPYYHGVLMISCPNNKVISLPSTSMGWWLIEDKMMWNDWESSSCASDLTVTQVTQHLSTAIAGCPGTTLSDNSEHPPSKLNSSTSFSDPRICESKMLRTGNCWLSELRCVDWSSTWS